MPGKKKDNKADYSLTMIALYNALYSIENPYSDSKESVFVLSKKLSTIFQDRLLEKAEKMGKPLFATPSEYSEILRTYSDRPLRSCVSGSQKLFLLTHLGGWRSGKTKIGDKTDPIFHDNKRSDGGIREEFCEELLNGKYFRDAEGNCQFFNTSKSVGNPLYAGARYISEYIVECNYSLISNYYVRKDILRKVIIDFVNNMHEAEETRRIDGENSLLPENEEGIKELHDYLKDIIDAYDQLTDSESRRDWLLSRAISWLIIASMLRQHLEPYVMERCLKPYMFMTGQTYMAEMKKHEAETGAAENGVNQGNTSLNIDNGIVKKVKKGKKKKQEYTLMGNLKIATGGFFGRNNEIKKINKILNNPEGLVFLYGEPGIGKTQLAKKYAHSKHIQSIYKIIIIAEYDTDNRRIIDLICDDETFELQGFEGRGKFETQNEYYSRKIKVLKKLLSDQVLIILDNFDTNDDARFKDFISLNCKKIITSRLSHEEYKSQEIHISAIEEFNALYEIFDFYYGYPLSQNEYERTILNKIFGLIHSHTYAIELIAKQMQKSHKSTTEIYNLLKEGIKNLPSEIIKAKGTESSAFDHLCALYKISDLGEAEKYILRCLSLVGIYGISTRLFMDWLGLQNYDAFNNLVARGWIREDGTTWKTKCSLHPLTIEVVKECLKPDISNCKTFLFSLQKYLYYTWTRAYVDNIEIEKNVDAIFTYFKAPSLDNYQLFTWYGSYLWQIGRFDKSISYFENFYKTNNTVPNANVIHLALLERALAAAYFNSGNELQSISYYEKSLYHLLKSNYDGSPDIALGYEKVGRCYTWEFSRDIEKAFSYFNQSFEIRLNVIDKIEDGAQIVDSESWVRVFDLRRAYAYLGTCQMEIGRMYRSFSCHLIALYYTNQYYYSLEKENFSNINGLSYSLYDMANSWFKIGVKIKAISKNSGNDQSWKTYSRKIFNSEIKTLKKFLHGESDSPLYKDLSTVKSWSKSEIVQETMTIIDNQNIDTVLLRTQDIPFYEKCYYISKVLVERAVEIILERRGDRAVDTIDYEELNGDILCAIGKEKDAIAMYKLALDTGTKLLQKNNPRILLLQKKIDDILKHMKSNDT